MFLKTLEMGIFRTGSAYAGVRGEGGDPPPPRRKSEPTKAHLAPVWPLTSDTMLHCSGAITAIQPLAPYPAFAAATSTGLLGVCSVRPYVYRDAVLALWKVGTRNKEGVRLCGRKHRVWPGIHRPL